ncbi:MAG TPA: acyl-CoA dehydrogenase family protein [Burkholderiales bacterium]|nr:acyl-CoA dehydrogenase family protein [Burkholderiales bacterium]
MNLPDRRYYTQAHSQFRDALARFVREEIMPEVEAWEEAGEFPRELYRKAAAVGLLGIGFPEEYGGTPADVFYHLVALEELAEAGSGGLIASLLSHDIGAPPILHCGSEALKRRVLPEILSGEKISALAITEPSGGSDVARLRTSARLEGGEYVVNGSKMFITSGMRADYYTVAVRTGGPGAAGVSLLLVERERPGFTRTPLKKMGWWTSDTAALYFDEVRVPAANLIGAEGEGFKAIMSNFNMERLTMSAIACGFSRVCLEDALAWARERSTFGAPLIERQVIRHKLVDMQTRIDATRALLEDLAWRVQQGAHPVAQLAMLKNFATQTMQFCADQAVQILGGAGYVRGTRPERIYREVKVMMIGGGTEEIMKDLAARQLGW